MPANHNYGPRDPTIRRDTARGIVVRGDQILLIERWRGDLHYFSIPGGGIEPDESPEEAVVRELAEETNIEVKAERPLYVWREGLHVHNFFLCEYIRGEPLLRTTAEEYDRPDNKYLPQWIATFELNNLMMLYWEPVRKQLIKDLNGGFSDHVKVITTQN